jgi:hypothetical protein
LEFHPYFCPSEADTMTKNILKIKCITKYNFIIVQVLVEVGTISNQKPVFGQPSYEGNVTENAKPGTPVLQVITFFTPHKVKIELLGMYMYNISVLSEINM